MFERILIPLDGSSLAERSIPHAIKFAQVFNSRVWLMRVLEPVVAEECPLPAEPLQWQLLRAKIDSYMHITANKIRQSLGIPEVENETENESRVRVSILDGKVAETIIDFTQQESIDLLIMSSHGLGGLSRWNLNSVITKVFNQINTSMLVIRAYQPESADAELPDYKQILVALDGSRRAECSLNAAVGFANVKPSKLILTSVIRPIEVPAAEPFHQELLQKGMELLELTRKAVKYYLEELSLRVSVPNEVQIIENPSVIQAVLNLADEKNIDLLVICAHGFTGDANFPYGTLARGFVEFSTKPVLIIQDLLKGQTKPGEAAQVAESTRSRE